MSNSSRNNFGHIYKRKSGGIDKRALRALRKSVDWKLQRDGEVNKRRQLDGDDSVLSPVVEKKSVQHCVPATNASESRRDMLLRWKQQKEMKRKQEQMEQARKKPFRVVHLVPDLIPFKSNQPESVAKPATKKAKPNPVKETKHAAPAQITRQQTGRSKGSAMHAAVPPAPQSRVNMRRGQTSFAPADFKFSAPPHMAYEFRPLSPSSAAVFLRPQSNNASPTVVEEIKLEVNSGSSRPVRVSSKPSTTLAATAAPSKVDKQKTQKSSKSTSSAIIDAKTTRSTAKASTVKTSDKPVSSLKQVKTLGRSGANQSRHSSNEAIAVSQGTAYRLRSGRGAPATGDNPPPVGTRPTLRSTAVAIIDGSASKSMAEDKSRKSKLTRVEKLTTVFEVTAIATKDDSFSTAAHEDKMAETTVGSAMKTQARRKSRRSLAVEQIGGKLESHEEGANVLNQFVDQAEVLENNHTVEMAYSSVSTECSLKSSVETFVGKSSSGQTQEDNTAVGPTEAIACGSNDSMVTASKQKKRKSVSARKLVVEELKVTVDESVEKMQTDDHETSSKNDPEHAQGNMRDVDALFLTPGNPRRSRRSVAHDGVSGSCTRKTPRNVRNSLILRHFSPEECVEILKESPMVEMIRRRRSVPVTPMVDLDDVDEIIKTMEETGQSAEDVINQSLHEKHTTHAESTAELVQPSGDISTPSSSEENHLKCPTQTQCLQMDTVMVEKDVRYFRDLMRQEIDRLSALCASWREILSSTSGLAEEIQGSIRTVIGQAELLMNKKFKQFSGLVDNCEFNTGENPVTCTDLQGFWEMMYFQVEDVVAKFKGLDELKASNWVKLSPIKRKPVKKPAPSAVSKPADSKPVAAKSSFAEFRRKMQQQKKVTSSDLPTAMENEDAAQAVSVGEVAVVDSQSALAKSAEKPIIEKTFDGGFYTVTSPVRSNHSTPNITHSKESVGRLRRSGISASPLLTNVLLKSARKSLGIVVQSPSRSVKLMDKSNVGMDSTKPNSIPDSNDGGQTKRLRSILHHSDANGNASGVGDKTSSLTQSAERRRRSTRKSVFFSDVNPSPLGDLYTMRTDFSEPSTPVSNATPTTSRLSSTPYSPSQSLLALSIDKENVADSRDDEIATPVGETTRLVDIDEQEDLAPCGFGRLRVGFTPGVDGKSRRISGFSPMTVMTSVVPKLGSLDEDASENCNLMDFSPVATNEAKRKVRTSSARASQQFARRRSSRLSVVFN